MTQDFVDALGGVIDDKIAELHTALPAEIVEFNQDTLTVDVVPKAKMTLSSGQSFEYPRINDVPILFPCGMGKDAVIVYPVKKGDGCLLIFSEQSLDYWQSSGVMSSEMKFSLTSAIAIPGLFAKPAADIGEAVMTDSIIIRNGTNKIGISKSKITIKGDIDLEGNLTINGELKSNK